MIFNTKDGRWGHGALYHRTNILVEFRVKSYIYLENDNKWFIEGK